MDFTKNFNTVMTDLSLAYFVPQDLCMFSCVCEIQLVITRTVFPKLFCA